MRHPSLQPSKALQPVLRNTAASNFHIAGHGFAVDQPCHACLLDALQVRSIPSDMTFHGKGPLLSASDADYDLAWIRAQQVRYGVTPSNPPLMTCGLACDPSLSVACWHAHATPCTHGAISAQPILAGGLLVCTCCALYARRGLHATHPCRRLVHTCMQHPARMARLPKASSSAVRPAPALTPPPPVIAGLPAMQGALRDGHRDHQRWQPGGPAGPIPGAEGLHPLQRLGQAGWESLREYPGA